MIVWKKQTGRHQWGWNACIGRYVVGSTYHDSARSRDDPKKWAVVCTLPGIKTGVIEYHETEDGAKARVEEAINHWMKHAEVKFNEESN